MILFAADDFAPDEPEGSAKSEYMSGKDWRWIIGIIVIVSIALWPVYRIFDDQRKDYVCKTNMGGIAKALQSYATGNDDRFPPLYEITPEGNVSVGSTKDGNSGALVWLSPLGDHLRESAEFSCPAAHADEHSDVLLFGSGFERVVPLTYGMYATMSALPTGDITKPDETVLIAETSNQGAQGSYDPVPNLNSEGPASDNGFCIGWDNSNFFFDKDTKTVTRLAFRGSAGGDFRGERVSGRHNQGINAVTVDGNLIRLAPSGAYVSHRPPYLEGLWETPATFQGVWGQ
ncbi:MAG: hypothetical protein KF812_02120 [Fimbriimonadaceae bacterium]|nr:hypothetical protein [Fimbriimonadaceae bacterium]